jgi:hypothetical protein
MKTETTLVVTAVLIIVVAGLLGPSEANIVVALPSSSSPDPANVTLNWIGLPAEESPVNRWLPIAGTNISGIVRICPSWNDPSTPTTAMERAVHAGEIVLCGIDPNLGLPYYEDVLRLAERWGFAAVLLVTKGRPGTGFYKTDGTVATAPHIPVQEIHALATSLLQNGTQVALPFTGHNLLLDFDLSPGWTLIQLAWGGVQGVLLLWNLYRFWEWVLYLGIWPMRVQVLSLGVELLANIFGFIDALDFYNSRHVYSSDFSRIVFTVHIPLRVISLLIVAANFHVILSSSKKLSSAVHTPDGLRYAFYATATIILTLELTATVVSLAARNPPFQWSLFVINFYALSLIVASVFNVVTLVRLRAALKSTSSAAEERRQAIFRKFERDIVIISAAAVVWVILLEMQTVIAFTVTDFQTYVYLHRLTGPTAFIFCAGGLSYACVSLWTIPRRGAYELPGGKTASTSSPNETASNSNWYASKDDDQTGATRPSASPRPSQSQILVPITSKVLSDTIFGSASTSSSSPSSSSANDHSDSESPSLNNSKKVSTTPTSSSTSTTLVDEASASK